ncbi:MAG: protein jag [Spirochaetes bacterium]|nr:protein jag [Spirochaetota bacterium]
MKVIEVEGKSIDDAKKKAAKELGLDYRMLSADADIEILDEGKTGMFGLGISRAAKIRVSINVNTTDIAGEVVSVFTELMRLMDIKAEISEMHEGAAKVYLEIESSDSGLIIGKKGKTLEAIQFLVNLMVATKTKSEKKIILDIESYRAKRERALKRLSYDIAKKVIRSGKPWTLEPMNPFERRLIHLTLQNNDQVDTKSEGQGIYRKVRISPKNYKG